MFRAQPFELISLALLMGPKERVSNLKVVFVCRLWRMPLPNLDSLKNIAVGKDNANKQQVFNHIHF